VWKQEFRIGAAYEIENSTAIYSGLLRFADLNIFAPSPLYPMFIVAPTSRKNRLREQLRRPAFQRLALDKKVRFLSYEAIDEIDSFFADSSTGLSVELVVGKSELVA
jgi:type II restriction enzyme